VGAGVVGPGGRAADRDNHLRPGHPRHQQRGRRTGDHSAVDDHIVVTRTRPDDHTVLDASDHDSPFGRDDDRTFATCRESDLDATATAPSLVERERASDTRVTPDSRPGRQPLIDRASRCRNQVRAAFVAVNAWKM
jgi:hypothetical protein